MTGLHREESTTAKFANGQTVRISGVVTKPALNGQTATIVGKTATATKGEGRYIVRIDGGPGVGKTKMSLKPECLEVIIEGQGPGGGGAGLIDVGPPATPRREAWGATPPNDEAIKARIDEQRSLIAQLERLPKGAASMEERSRLMRQITRLSAATTAELRAGTNGNATRQAWAAVTPGTDALM